jgi:hypothetical protein
LKAGNELASAGYRRGNQVFNKNYGILERILLLDLHNYLKVIKVILDLMPTSLRARVPHPFPCPWAGH